MRSGDSLRQYEPSTDSCSVNAVGDEPKKRQSKVVKPVKLQRIGRHALGLRSLRPERS